MESLFRPNDVAEFQPRKVLIVGNGAVVGGWKPMVEAIRKSNLFERHVDYSDQELAQFVHLLPSQFVHEYVTSRSVAFEAPPEDLDEAVLVEAGNFLENFFNYIKEVSNGYNTEFRFRKEIRFIASLVDSTTGTISLNYDNSLWNYNDGHHIKFEKLLHLHGAANEPESLYFPFDSTVLDELLGFLNAIPDTIIRKSIGSTVLHEMKERLGDRAGYLQRRTDDLRRRIKSLHKVAMKWVRDADEIVLWGVGFNPYDAELLSILNRSTGAALKPRRLTIVNIDKKAGEMVRLFLHVDSKNYRFIKAARF